MRRFVTWFGRITDSLTRQSHYSSHRSRRHRLPVAPQFELLECRALLAAGVTPTFTVSNDWGSGFQAEIRLDNHQSTAVVNWRLDFDMPANISSIWDAKITSRVGNHYVVQNAGYNKLLPAGRTAAFGFTASPGNVTAGPTNYVLTSVGGETPGGTNQAPIAGADFAFTSPGQGVAIDVLANDRDPDGDTLTLASFTQAAQGAVVINANRTVTYTPKPGFVGSDGYTYQLRDARGATTTGTVSITVSSTVSS